MINEIKNQSAKISRLNITIGFCMGVFVLMVRQNSASADESIKRPNYSSDSLTEFISDSTKHSLSKIIVSAKQEYKSNFDLKSDYSLQKYISDENLLENKKYIPSDLSKITSDFIVNRAQRDYLREPARLAFEKMAKTFNEQLDGKFYLISAYRTYRDQSTLFERGCSTDVCAKVGGSEHQLGLAIDIHLATSNGYNKFTGDYLDRMNTNAHKYGFINTYRKGKNVDGKTSEVWHWRYVGTPFATKLYEDDLSFAEYNKLTQK